LRFKRGFEAAIEVNVESAETSDARVEVARSTSGVVVATFRDSVYGLYVTRLSGKSARTNGAILSG
jgi:hypothetical protein